MNRLTKFFKLWMLLIPVWLLTGCHSNTPAEKNVFYYNEQTGIASLDPAFAKNQSIMWAVHQLYNTLVEVDSNLKIVPSIAKSWDISPDRLTYTFHLRKDISFHDDDCFAGAKGRVVTATDIVYSLSRIQDKKVASPGAWIFNNKVDSLSPFVALNDSTFQLHLQKPYTPILGILSMQYCSVVPKEAVEKYGADFRRHPVGSGPFQFVAWEERQALVLKRNPHYFETDANGKQLPFLDGVKVSFYDSKATEFLLFRQHKLDFINDIESSFKDEILTKAGALRSNWKDKIVLQTHPYLNTEYLGILVDTNNLLLQHSPLKIEKIRQAMNYAFDRKKMVLYLRNSIGTPATSGFVPAGVPGFDTSAVKGYSYDPEKARRLLAEAGFPGGKGLPRIRLLTIAIYADLASFIAKELEETGIPVQVEVVQKSLLLDMTSNSKAAFFRASWIADYPDAENYLSVFYSKNPAPPNYTRYNNPEFDKLFEAALAETNDSLRYKLNQRADQLMINDAPIIPLWYDEAIHLVQPYVKNFSANSLNLLELRCTKKQ